LNFGENTMQRIALRSGRAAALLVLLAVIDAFWTVATAAIVPPGQTLLYVIARDTGAFAGVLLSVNGKVVATLGPKSYLIVAVDPGLQRLGSAASRPGSFEISTAAGHTYYVELRVAANGIPEFRRASEDDALVLLAQSRQLGDARTVPPPEHAPVSTPVRSSGAAAGANPAYAEPTFADRQAIAIILRGGAYTLTEERQLIDGSTALLEARAKSDIALEVEWRHPTGFATGGEVFYFRNNWTDPGLGLAGDVDTVSATINGKYYLGIADVVYPYLGVGLGYAWSSFSGSARGDAGGLAYQGLAGVEVRFRYVGVNVGYKYLVTDVRSKNSLGKTETNPMGGSGTLIGLTVHVPIR
jgi:hypothetical protein